MKRDIKKGVLNTSLFFQIPLRFEESGHPCPAADSETVGV